jgi:hypothetical protein
MFEFDWLPKCWRCKASRRLYAMPRLPSLDLETLRVCWPHVKHLVPILSHCGCSGESQYTNRTGVPNHDLNDHASVARDLLYKSRSAPYSTVLVVCGLPNHAWTIRGGTVTVEAHLDGSS